MQQYRPPGVTTPKYAPERDLAHFGPVVLAPAMGLLDKPNWTAEFSAYVDRVGITDDELGDAIGKYADAQRHFVGDLSVNHVEAAYAASGFQYLPYILRQVIFGVVGEAVTAAWFKAVRDVTTLGESDTPSRHEMDVFLAATTAISQRLTNATQPFVASVTVECESLRRMLAACQVKVSLRDSELADVRLEKSKLQKELALTIDTSKSRDAMMDDIQDRVDELESQGLWQHLVTWWNRHR